MSTKWNRALIGCAVAALMASSGSAVGAEEGSVAAEKKIHFHGYGEVHYNSPRGSDFPNRLQTDLQDGHRFVIGLSYKWTDQFSLEAEVDYEHAAAAMELEFIHVDYHHSDAINLRGGVILMPVGPLNEFHEPTRFYSVERPYMDNMIIPTTWQDAGAGIYGKLNMPWSPRYRTYLVAGLNGEGFSADKPIRSARGRARETNTTGASWVGRLELTPFLGLDLGASGYYGSSGVKSSNLHRGQSDVRLWEADAKFMKGPFELQARYATLSIGNAAFVTANNGTNNDPVADRSTAWLGEGALHLGRWLFSAPERDLVPFVRYERINTQDEVATSLTRNPSFDRKILTAGLAFYPIEEIVLKADVEDWKIGTGNSDQRYNVGLGFVY